MKKVYWYELVYRGISIGTHPKGAVAIEHQHVNRKGFEYGAVAYAKPLTEKEISDYELEPIEAPRELLDYEKELLELLS